MLYKNITKKLLLVILCAAAPAALTGCGHGPVRGGSPPRMDDGPVYDPPHSVGRLSSPEITESSGIASSKCQDGVLWTHNDSGDGPFIFAVDRAGKSIGVWRVDGAENIDWEDIASVRDTAGQCTLYIGDIGNQKNDPRTRLRVYRVAEPEISAGGGNSEKGAVATARAEVLEFTYPNSPHDAEALMVHPATGDIYIATKSRNTPSSIFRLRPSSFNAAPAVAEKVAEITVPAIPNGFLTGGDISPNGDRLVICDYFAAYEFTLPAGAGSFDEIWKQKPAIVDLGDREQGEAIAYAADGNSLFATSEGKNRPLIHVVRR